MNSPAISNNLIWAILATLFCCLPLGIVSIIYAAKVDGLVAAGNYAAAQEAADKAKSWALWAAGAFVILMLLYVVFFVVVGMSAAGLDGMQ
ncbi:MAG: CD225/dispanin family protein [Thermomonas sp.]|uniref:CD225/dispanin family protein n=1 Tax=Thermomonas sp. TaxID=1971895 RepID=UPI001E1565EF|nr:CD225/dispanin family protein [Thermomonas sp.]MBZ0087514.1 CD225/dispanin family protein [Thermomonas sp.]